jgi:hypothetical protein
LIPRFFCPIKLFELRRNCRREQTCTVVNVSSTGEGLSSLIQILHDKGLPPSNRDRRVCNPRQTALRCDTRAAVHLLRLCDSRLDLEKKYLTAGMWYTLSEAFRRREGMREVAMEELTPCSQEAASMASRDPVSCPTTVATLRISFVVLCNDGDHGRTMTGPTVTLQMLESSPPDEDLCTHCIVKL